ncbi:377f3cf2-a9fb-417e-8677-5f07cbadc8b1 [Thermothielavioides terrestris]|uniref:377f3cf2-a9fb-417e-8677-5f07cbadc8b1 n=1 Tax=Thermothielavioides terrestris TaxID=2587410 RepID=A0A3S4EZB1_9PEZI|nr:377f3cf2-a9fb-417e-8677-5f07cbadc8b1 [Thermothielavioides terrestris]
MWPYSPETDHLEFEVRQYDSDLIPNELFGLPTQERRDAWDWLWKTGRISFPYEKLDSVNKSTEAREWWTLPFPRNDEVIAMSEVMHQVHCVGVLWLFAHRDNWDYRTILNRTELFMQIHQRHCGVVLLEMVKCMADVTPVLFQHDGNKRLGAWKPRDAPRRCKNFDLLAQWERDNSICPMACTPEDVSRIYNHT